MTKDIIAAHSGIGVLTGGALVFCMLQAVGNILIGGVISKIQGEKESVGLRGATHIVDADISSCPLCKWLPIAYLYIPIWVLTIVSIVYVFPYLDSFNRKFVGHTCLWVGPITKVLPTSDLMWLAGSSAWTKCDIEATTVNYTIGSLSAVAQSKRRKQW